MVTIVFTNIDAFWRSVFPVFIGNFEAFYIFCDAMTIYAAGYFFIWFLMKVAGR